MRLAGMAALAIGGAAAGYVSSRATVDTAFHQMDSNRPGDGFFNDVAHPGGIAIAPLALGGGGMIGSAVYESRLGLALSAGFFLGSAAGFIARASDELA